MEVAEEAKEGQKKSKINRKRNKKKTLPNLNLGATDFIPNFTFSPDPTSEPFPVPTAAAALEITLTAAEGVTVAEKKKRVKKPAKDLDETKPVEIPVEVTVKEEAGEEPKPKTKRKKSKKAPVVLTFNVDAPVFAPAGSPTAAHVDGPPSKPAKEEKPVTQLPKPKSVFRPKPQPEVVAPTEPQADFGGYMNRHLNQDQTAESIAKQLAEQIEEEEKKVYSIDLFMSLRAANKLRPVNMALLDFPHKKRKGEFRREPISEIDKFNQSVGQIRILLNKLSLGNFETIENQILKNFEYTPSLLYELMKIIFMKATTEKSFLEIYVKLCVTLFKKYNDKENIEMNFRKLLLTRCEKQFYKMLKVEQEDRRSRRASMEEA